MKQKNYFVLLLMGLSLLLGCSGSGGSSNAQYGTVINTARPPMNSIVPDFETYIPETSVTDESVTATSTSSAIDVSDIPLLWQTLFTNGSIPEARLRRQVLETLGTNIVTSINNVDFSQVDTSNFHVNLEGELLSTAIPLEVTVLTDPTDSHYTRYNFYDTSRNQYVGTYLVSFDTDTQTPTKGLFAAVDRAAMTDHTQNGIRFFALVYDFTDPTKSLIMTRSNPNDANRQIDYTYQLYQECHSSTSDCTGEYLEISDPVPSRELKDIGIRFSWNEVSSQVCIADVDYSTGALQTNQTYAFTGPSAPTTDQIQTGTCSVTTPHWGNHVFTTNDLLLRYDDTDPAGGTAIAYLGDGTSLETWNTLTPALIDTWLDASGY